jgi:hypothetical protein
MCSKRPRANSQNQQKNNSYSFSRHIFQFGDQKGISIESFHKYQQKIIMTSLLYVIAVILLIGWIIGVFFYSLVGLIHILLVLAVVAVLFRLIKS